MEKQIVTTIMLACANCPKIVQTYETKSLVSSASICQGGRYMTTVGATFIKFLHANDVSGTVGLCSLLNKFIASREDI